MVKKEVVVYNEKKGSEKVKDFVLSYCEEYDSVIISLGNETFDIDYYEWKVMTRVLQDYKDKDKDIVDCEECMNG